MINVHGAGRSNFRDDISQMFEHLRRHPGDTETSSSMKISDSNRTTTTPQESCAAKGRDGNKEDVAINNNDPEVNRSTSSLSSAGKLNIAGENKERDFYSEKTASSTTLVSSYQHQNFIFTSGEQPAQKIMAPPGAPREDAARPSSKLHEGELAEKSPAVVDLFPDVHTVIACMKTICVKNPEVFSFCEFDFECVANINEDHSCGRHEEVGNKVATSESTRISSASHCSGTPSIPRNAILKVRTG